MAIEETKIKKCKCEKCKHEWIAREEKLPETCPNCKTKYWHDRGEVRAFS